MLAVGLGPAIAVGKRSKKGERGNRQDKEEYGGRLVYNSRILGLDARDSNSQKVEQLAKSDDGEVESREVVVQEELTLHEIEGEVVQSPAKNRSTQLVVKSLEGWVGIVIAATLPSQDGNALEQNPDDNGNGRRPPDNRVANEVNLSVVLAPEIDTATENGPRLGARVPSMRISQTCVGSPHDLLELDELAKEARVAVIDLFSIFSMLRVIVVLNIPQAVGHTAATCASHLLLLRGPIGEFDLVRE